MLNRSFLITRPQHEKVVSYLFCWAEEILKFAKDNNIKFYDLKGEKAIRDIVSSYIKKQEPKLVIFNGHGTPTTINGHKDKMLIESDVNEDLLVSKIIYAVSCDSAADLGKKAVQKGAETFIGYDGPFSFVNDANKECKPEGDKFAEPFKKTSNEIVISLLKGKTVKETTEKFERLSFDLINKYSMSDAEPGYKEIRFFLFWNKFFYKAIGNPQAVF